MNRLKANLLTSDELEDFNFDPNLQSETARGSYNPMQFTLRLREDIRRALDQDEITYEKVQAFSTFLHENIHWWQHVGSISGFITSLSYPALAHICYQDLTTLINKDEKYKSITDYDKKLYFEHGRLDNQEVNRILNNWHDIQYAKLFILDNKYIHKLLEDRRFFLHIGHCFHILWSSSINILGTIIDPNLDFLPKANKWLPEFKNLEKDKAEGFYIDSSMHIAPLGTRAIYEGQARFNQLQYLSIALNDSFDYKDFEDEGMLKGIYIEAFNTFLNVTGIERPKNLNNSVVGLFLLICDISINPTDGFPHDIYHFRSFIISNDPGMRFMMLCNEIKKERQFWENSIISYSKKEYEELSEKLCAAIMCFPPHYSSTIINKWIEEQESVKKLLAEESEMKFTEENLPIRLFCSKFFRFHQDKLKYPHFFCWSGKSISNESCPDIDSGLAEKLFEKHRALFVNDAVGIIKPMVFPGFRETDLIETFQKFFTYNTLYDMIIKWIRESGEFTYNYEWLTTKYPKEDMKKWIRNNFKNTFGIYPEDLTVIKK